MYLIYATGYDDAPVSTRRIKRHVGVTCNNCNAESFRGVRYKCSTCPEYDICDRCIDEVESKSLHPHAFIRISKPMATLNSMIICDHCNAEDFKGIRYKCSTCPDYDICSNCIDEVESNDLHPHTFFRISKPYRAVRAQTTGAIPALSDRSDWVHRGIFCSQCDGAKEGNEIVGYRFFCALCGVSLCEYCEQRGGHDPHHPLLKMVPPSDESKERK